MDLAIIGDFFYKNFQAIEQRWQIALKLKKCSQNVLSHFLHTLKIPKIWHFFPQKKGIYDKIILFYLVFLPRLQKNSTPK
jgi:hypothetical protein